MTERTPNATADGGDGPADDHVGDGSSCPPGGCANCPNRSSTGEDGDALRADGGTDAHHGDTQRTAERDHTVTLRDGDDVDRITVAAGETVLDAAEAAGIDLPHSCRMGACTSCVGRVIEGSVDQSKATGLDPGQRAEGYALMCVAKPETDCEIVVGVQEELFELV